jgi:hypothetical protein
MERTLRENAARPLFSGTAASPSPFHASTLTLTEPSTTATSGRSPSPHLYFIICGPRQCSVTHRKQVPVAYGNHARILRGNFFPFERRSGQSSHVQFQDYQEVVVPPTRAVPPRTSERLIPVAELDPLAQGSFPVSAHSANTPLSGNSPLIQGYTSLNRIQSIVYPTAYQSNENMLICGQCHPL